MNPVYMIIGIYFITAMVAIISASISTYKDKESKHQLRTCKFWLKTCLLCILWPVTTPIMLIWDDLAN